MNVFISIAEFCSYLLFSLLAGHVALQFVSDENKPKITISKQILLLCTLGIYIWSFAPVAQTISYFKDSVGLTLTAFSVITDFQVGRAWLIIGFVSVLFWITLMLNGSKYLQALWLFLMVLAVGYSSHVASLSFWNGLVAHSLHYLLVILWTGILIHVAWFSNEQQKWAKFLHWFTPFAVMSILVIILSGATLMIYVVELKDYVKSWVLPYGQMLLLKHISVIPLLVFAFINGVLAKKSLAMPDFNPRFWVKAESVIIFIIFYFTSVLGTLSPPHEVEFTVKSEGASKWVEWMFGKDILTTSNIEFALNFSTIFLSLISFLLLSLILLSFKKVKPMVGVYFGIGFIFTVYFGLMISLLV